MPTDGNYASKTVPFTTVFGEFALHVPEYQRSYAWDRKEVDELWDDLVDEWTEDGVFDPSRSTYFLGTIVTTPAEIGKPGLILDGQQRLATITIMLCAIRDTLQALGTDEGTVQAQAIQNQLLLTKLQDFILELNVEDRDFFKKAIQSFPPVNDTVPILRSHKRIARAKTLAAERIRRLTKGRSKEEISKILASLWRAIAQKIAVVTVSIQDEDEAGRVFEVLNDRGIELSVADLIRNMLITQVTGDAKKQTAKRWDGLIQSFKGADLSALLRYSWMSRHADISKREAYRKIKTGIRANAPMVVDYLDELEKDASVALILSRDKADDSQDPDRADQIYGLVALRARQAYPLLISVFQTCPSEFTKTLRRVNTLTIQFAVLGRNPRDIEGAYSVLAREVRTIGNNPTAISKTIGEALRSFAVDEQTFFEHFITFAPESAELQRYVLWEVEKTTGDNQEFRELSLNSPMYVNIEHLYPQNPVTGHEWSEKEHDLYVDRIGNLTLLGDKPNKELQNKPFEDKKEVYGKSKLGITNGLKDLCSWGPSDIDKRQAEFAEVAKKIWRFE